jgi:hypothetical protein
MKTSPIEETRQDACFSGFNIRYPISDNPKNNHKAIKTKGIYIRTIKYSTE